jgi:hypothetical protein
MSKRRRRVRWKDRKGGFFDLLTGGTRSSSYPRTFKGIGNIRSR